MELKLPTAAIALFFNRAQPRGLPQEGQHGGAAAADARSGEEALSRGGERLAQARGGTRIAPAERLGGSHAGQDVSREIALAYVHSGKERHAWRRRCRAGCLLVAQYNEHKARIDLQVYDQNLGQTPYDPNKYLKASNDY